MVIEENLKRLIHLKGDNMQIKDEFAVHDYDDNDDDFDEVN